VSEHKSCPAENGHTDSETAFGIWLTTSSPSRHHATCLCGVSGPWRSTPHDAWDAWDGLPRRGDESEHQRALLKKVAWLKREFLNERELSSACDKALKDAQEERDVADERTALYVSEWNQKCEQLRRAEQALKKIGRQVERYQVEVLGKEEADDD